MSTKKSANPTSPARIAANRANARKSTGPRTPEGKARSSRNALKHGLLARHAIIRDDPAEDRDAFDELLNQLTAEYQPVGPTQRLLVERIAVCYWRLRRALRYEADCVHNDRVVGRGCGPHEGLIYTKYDAAGSRGVLPVGPDFDRLIRYETMIDRQLNRLMAHLDHLRNHPSTDGLESPNPQPPTPTPHPSAPSQISNPPNPAPCVQKASHSHPFNVQASDFIGHSDYGSSSVASGRQGRYNSSYRGGRKDGPSRPVSISGCNVAR